MAETGPNTAKNRRDNGSKWKDHEWHELVPVEATLPMARSAPGLPKLTDGNQLMTMTQVVTLKELTAPSEICTTACKMERRRTSGPFRPRAEEKPVPHPNPLPVGKTRLLIFGAAGDSSGSMHSTFAKSRQAQPTFARWGCFISCGVKGMICAAVPDTTIILPSRCHFPRTYQHDSCNCTTLDPDGHFTGRRYSRRSIRRYSLRRRRLAGEFWKSSGRGSCR